MRDNPVLMSCNLNKQTTQSMEESKTVKCFSIYKSLICLLSSSTSVKWANSVIFSSLFRLQLHQNRDQLLDVVVLHSCASAMLSVKCPDFGEELGVLLHRQRVWRGWWWIFFSSRKTVGNRHMIHVTLIVTSPCITRSTYTNLSFCLELCLCKKM